MGKNEHKSKRQRKRLDVRWNTENMSSVDMDRWLERVIDIYCDAIVNNLKPAIDNQNHQR